MLKYTPEDATRMTEALREVFPYARVLHSTLGGEHRASLMVAVSLEPAAEWTYNIYENSRYARFAMHGGSVKDKLEKFSGWKTAPFRKATIKSVDDAIARIIKWASAEENQVAPKPVYE
jgi:hypothetical protein